MTTSGSPLPSTPILSDGCDSKIAWRFSRNEFPSLITLIRIPRPRWLGDLRNLDIAGRLVRATCLGYFFARLTQRQAYIERRVGMIYSLAVNFAYYHQ
jgi:hypothetical protein